MIVYVKNITKNTQQIMLINGESITVYPNKSVEFDQYSVFPEELNRISNFFIIEKNIITTKISRTVRTTVKKNLNGGN